MNLTVPSLKPALSRPGPKLLLAWRLRASCSLGLVGDLLSCLVGLWSLEEPFVVPLVRGLRFSVSGLVSEVVAVVKRGSELVEAS